MAKVYFFGAREWVLLAEIHLNNELKATRWIFGEHCGFVVRGSPVRVLGQTKEVDFQCGVCMFFPRLPVFSLGDLISSHSPKMHIWMDYGFKNCKSGNYVCVCVSCYRL